LIEMAKTTRHHQFITDQIAEMHHFPP
jgi:hypothetical protein